MGTESNLLFGYPSRRRSAAHCAELPGGVVRRGAAWHGAVHSKPG